MKNELMSNFISIGLVVVVGILYFMLVPAVFERSKRRLAGGKEDTEYNLGQRDNVDD